MMRSTMSQCRVLEIVPQARVVLRKVMWLSYPPK
jgi:hypothetical protein